jgi:hypothetical protein
MTTAIDYRRAIARHEERLALLLTEMEEMVKRARLTGIGVPHLAHNLSARCVEVAQTQTTITVLTEIAASLES